MAAVVARSVGNHAGGSQAALVFGVWEDLGLVVAGALFVKAAWKKKDAPAAGRVALGAEMVFKLERAKRIANDAASH
jgi:hypothetical protein